MPGEEYEQLVADHAALKERYDRLEERLRRKARRLERSNRDLAQFAYIASHDLQEPLRMVTRFTELLAEEYGDRLDGEAGDYLRYILGGTRRMQEMVSALLEYAQVDAGSETLVIFDPEQAVRDAQDNLYLRIQESGATIHCDPLPRVLADRSQLTSLFQNLFSNAIKFSEGEPTLHISGESRDGEVIFSVVDDGIGFDMRHANRIFRLFKRLDPDGKPGNGIGLAICRRIVERHGGWIEARSEQGKGTTIRFALRMPNTGAI